MIVTELIKKYVKVREYERSIQTVWRRADCSGRHKCISCVDGKHCAGSGRHACAAHRYMGQQCDLKNRETIDEGDNADIWSHDSGGGCRNCTAVGIWGSEE